jgi:hypothetical protein
MINEIALGRSSESVTQTHSIERVCSAGTAINLQTGRDRIIGAALLGRSIT